MAKQRSCAHRREIVREKREISLEERKRREEIKKTGIQTRGVKEKK